MCTWFDRNERKSNVKKCNSQKDVPKGIETLFHKTESESENERELKKIQIKNDLITFGGSHSGKYILCYSFGEMILANIFNDQFNSWQLILSCLLAKRIKGKMLHQLIKLPSTLTFVVHTLFLVFNNFFLMLFHLNSEHLLSPTKLYDVLSTKQEHHKYQV